MLQFPTCSIHIFLILPFCFLHPTKIIWCSGFFAWTPIPWYDKVGQKCCHKGSLSFYFCTLLQACTGRLFFPFWDSLSTYLLFDLSCFWQRVNLNVKQRRGGSTNQKWNVICNVCWQLKLYPVEPNELTSFSGWSEEHGGENLIINFYLHQCHFSLCYFRQFYSLLVDFSMTDGFF